MDCTDTTGSEISSVGSFCSQGIEDGQPPATGASLKGENEVQPEAFAFNEPSLQLSAEALQQLETGGTSAPGPPADDVEFLSSHNSPDIPGASSVYISNWGSRGLGTHSPRSERSSRSSVYHAGSNQTSVTGMELRSLVHSNEPRAGLESGDVIMLMQQGRPYVAVKVQLPYKADAWHTCLQLAGDDVAPEQQGLTYLEVVKQGPFVGLRSGAAGNRFVQPRRKSPHLLVFFNDNCGVWEQWEVLGDRWRSDPWAEQHMVFRSRQLPKVQLAVDVVRVGFFSAPGPGSTGPFAHTPRWLLPAIPEEGRMEDANLKRMSNLMLQEWFKFVDNEKTLREGLQSNLAELIEDVAQLKINTISQVEYLRVHMNQELSDLLQHVTMRDEAIGTLRDWVRRAQQLAADRLARQRHRRILQAWRFVVDGMMYGKVAVIKLTRRRERVMRERCFYLWLSHTRVLKAVAAKLQTAIQRRAQAIMSRALLGWQQVLAHSVWRGRTLMAAIQRSASRRLMAAFSTWRMLTAQRAVGRVALLRALTGVRQVPLAAALTAWRAEAAAAQRKVVQAELMVVRRAARVLATALAGWHAEAFQRRLIARHARVVTLRLSFAAWRRAVACACSSRDAAEALAAAGVEALRQSAFFAWRNRAGDQVALRKRLSGHVLARSRAVQGRALTAWAHTVRERRRRRVALTRHQRIVRLRLAVALLTGWRVAAARNKWRRGRLVAALDRTVKRRLSAVLTIWRSYSAARRATLGRGELAHARIARMRLVAAFGRWQHLSVRMRLARRRLQNLCGRLKSCTLSAAFRDWRLVARSAASSRSLAARALPPHIREMLRHLLGMWWAKHCAAPWGLGECRTLRGNVCCDPSMGSGLWDLSSASNEVRDTPWLNGQQPSMQPVHESVLEPDQSEMFTARQALSEPLHQQGTRVLEHVTTLSARCMPASLTASSAPSRGGAASVPPCCADEAGNRSPQSPCAKTYEQVHQQPPCSVSQDGAMSPAAKSVGPASTPPRPYSAVLMAPAPSRGSAAGSASTLPTRRLTAPQASLPASNPFETIQHQPQPDSMLPHRRTHDGAGNIQDGGVPPRSPLPSATPTRSYREVLLVGSHTPRPSGSDPGNRPNSVGRIRAVRKAISIRGTPCSPGGPTSPFVPANAAVIGASASPVMVERAPGRSGEGPLTPVGLPELLAEYESASVPPVSTPLVLKRQLVSEPLPGRLRVELRGHLSHELEEQGEQQDRSWADVLRSGQSTRQPSSVHLSNYDPHEEPIELSQEPSLSRLGQLSQTGYGLLQQEEVQATLMDQQLSDQDYAPEVSRRVGLVGEPDMGAILGQSHASAPVEPSLQLTCQPISRRARSAGAVPTAGDMADSVCSGLGRWMAAVVLTRLRRAVAARRRWVATLETVAADTRQQVALGVLTYWSWEVTAAKKRVSAAETMAEKSSRAYVRKALVCWHDLALRRAVCRALVVRHIVRAVVVTASRVLALWHAVAADRAAARRRVARLTSRRQDAVLNHVFSAWREQVAESAARRNVADKRATSLNRGVLTCALQSWSGAASAAAAERRARQARAARITQRRQLQSAFSRWRWAADAANERAQLAVRASRSSALRSAFSGWLEATSGSPRWSVGLDAAMQRAATWHERRLLRLCLAALAEHRERQQQMLLEFVACRQHAMKAAVLAHWRAAIINAQRIAVALLQMVVRTSSRLLGRAMFAWLDLVEVLRTARSTAENLGCRVDCAVLADVMAGWRLVAASSAECRLRLLASRRRILRGCMSRVFWCWHEMAKELRQRQEHQLVARRRVQRVFLRQFLTHWAALTKHLREGRSYAARCAAAHDAVRLSIAFLAWHELARLLSGARATAATRGAHLDTALQRKVLSGWLQELEAAQRRAAAAEELRERRVKAVLPAVLRAWAAVALANGARRLQRAALGHLVLRRCRQLQRRAFQAWQAALAQRKATDDELRRCIKRKKLAFTLFKQWYWEAFDVDVQATIRRMFHTTDPAAHSPDPSTRNRSLTGNGTEWTSPGNGATTSRRVSPSYRGRSPPAATAVGTRTRTLAANSAGPAVPHTGIPNSTQLQHRLQQVASTRQATNDSVSQHHHPPSQHPHQQVKRWGEAVTVPRYTEPVRTLAPTFEALAAASGPGSAGPMPPPRPTPTGTLPWNRQQQPLTAGSIRSMSSAGPSALASRPLPGKMLNPLLQPLHSDSESTSEGESHSQAQHYVGANRISAANIAPNAQRRKEAPPNPVAFGRSVARASGSAVPPRHSTSGSSRRPRVSASATATMSGSTGIGSVHTSASQLEGMTSMNAMLVTVASHLTEMSRTSLEIAAGVVGAAGTGSGNRGHASASSITSNGMSHQPYPHNPTPRLLRRTTDGSMQGTTEWPSAGPAGTSATEAAVSVGVPASEVLSPLSPSPAAPYGNLYEVASAGSVGSGGGGSSNSRLPGALATWRQVATNQLYDPAEEWYGGEYDTLDQYHAGMGSTVHGANGGVAAEDAAESDSSPADIEGSLHLLAAGAPAAPSGAPARSYRSLRKSMVGFGDGSGSGSSSRALSECNSFPPHSTYRNEVFAPQGEEEDE